MSYFRKKKIIYILGTLDIGGAEKQVVQTATRLNRERFTPKLYCLSKGGPLKAYLDQHNVEVTAFNTTHPNSPFKIFRKFLSLYLYLRREQPDIVHCYMYTPSIYGGIGARLTGIPLLLTSRRRLGYFKDKKPHYQFLENFVNRFTNGVVVNSQAVKDDVLRREAIDPEKIHVIHNGVDIHEFKPVERLHPSLLHKKRELGIPETSPVVGMIANFFPYKGHHEFIIAASEIHRHYPQARFLCVGEDCGIQQQLEQLCRELGIYKYIIFTKGDQNVPELIHLIDIQVSASYEEGFSNVILEGMASGKPIIATSVGGTPEAVLHNVTGLLISPKDPTALTQAILSLLNNPEFASILGHNGRKRGEKHFSMEKMIDKLENLYLK